MHCESPELVKQNTKLISTYRYFSNLLQQKLWFKMCVRCVGYLESLDLQLGLVVPDVDVTVVERAEQPRLCRVLVHALDAVRTRRQLPLDVQSQRLPQHSNTIR